MSNFDFFSGGKPVETPVFLPIQGAPFNAHGSIIDLFKDLTIRQGIVKVIQNVNANALVKL